MVQSKCSVIVNYSRWPCTVYTLIEHRVCGHFAENLSPDPDYNFLFSLPVMSWYSPWQASYTYILNHGTPLDGRLGHLPLYNMLHYNLKERLFAPAFGCGSVREHGGWCVAKLPGREIVVLCAEGSVAWQSIRQRSVAQVTRPGSRESWQMLAGCRFGPVRTWGPVALVPLANAQRVLWPVQVWTRPLSKHAQESGLSKWVVRLPNLTKSLAIGGLGWENLPSLQSTLSPCKKIWLI